MAGQVRMGRKSLALLHYSHAVQAARGFLVPGPGLRRPGSQAGRAAKSLAEPAVRQPIDCRPARERAVRRNALEGTFASVRHAANVLINGVLLKPFGLKLAFRAGSDPVDDMARLLLNRSVPVAIDGGAYEGQFSRDLLRRFPSAVIHAFEPTPESYTRLEQKTRGASGIVRHQLAIGSANGKACFFLNSSALTNSLHESTSIGHHYFTALVADQGALEVQVVTLADFARAQGLTAIDIVKLDLQGAELEALIGMGALIDTVKIIYTEVQFAELYKDAPLFGDIDSFLRKREFTLYQLYDLVRSPKDGRLLFGDAMFVRSEITAEDADA